MGIVQQMSFSMPVWLEIANWKPVQLFWEPKNVTFGTSFLFTHPDSFGGGTLALFINSGWINSTFTLCIFAKRYTKNSGFEGLKFCGKILVKSKLVSHRSLVVCNSMHSSRTCNIGGDLYQNK